MKLVIVDDEALARARLREMVDALPGWDVVGEAANGNDALDLIVREQPDVALLDIRMAGKDGLQVARELADLSPPPAVIFTTAFSEHALSAFDANATAYLLKPIRREKLIDALQSARRPSRAQLLSLAALKADRPERTHIIATSRGRLARIPVEEVVYFYADQKYTTVLHLGGELLIEESLKHLEADLAPMFLRIHRKALISREFVAGIEREKSGASMVRMRHTDRLLPISRRRLADVRRLLAGREPDDE